MTLDMLYYIVREAKYPIYDREQLMTLLGNVRIRFEEDVFDARDIGTMITEYPIKSPSHLMELFIKAAQEEYNLDEEHAADFRKIES